MSDTRPMVFVVGVVLADQPTLYEAIRTELGSSHDWLVIQAWQFIEKPYLPKFAALNTVLQDSRFAEALAACRYLLVIDDDIRLPPKFVDRYLRYIEQCDFQLAQPARTATSEIHHPIVQQVSRCVARETRFVEIGPLFSVRRDVLSKLIPFDESSPMGWGYDYVWPLQVERMGIVDATPIEHRFRRAVSNYNGASEQMQQYLAKHAHLTPNEAYVEVRRHV